MKFKSAIFLIVLLFFNLLFGWGKNGHKIINRSSTYSFNEEISFMVSWAEFLADHGSDADDRKSWDPNEGYKHYIDIDAFPEFISTGAINQNFDSLVAQHGLSFVEDQGILPWTIMLYVDSLKQAFENNDWDKAKLLASDIGHYVGDAHMPLHLTLNYNGYATNQGGIHSRYESTMINRNLNLLQYSGDSLAYIEDLSDFVFGFIYSNYTYVDSLLEADLEAKSIAGSYNNVYYQELWNRTNDFTKRLLKSASNKMASLIYTAWIDAGSPTLTNINNSDFPANDFLLEQNYPNPFNPSTKIQFSIPSIGGRAKASNAFNASTTSILLKIYDILGNEIATLVDEPKAPGKHEVEFDGSDLSNGVYLYNLQINSSGSGMVQTKKMLLVK